MHVEYPHSFRTTTADDYHGHRIEDPYRWMEALDTPEIKAWIEAQNAVPIGIWHRFRYENGCAPASPGSGTTRRYRCRSRCPVWVW